MLEAIRGLNQEITKLETTARDSARLSIIRGISHDIVTPVAQLRKYMATFGRQIRDGRSPSEETLLGFEQSLKRLSWFAKQTQADRANKADAGGGRAGHGLVEHRALKSAPVRSWDRRFRGRTVMGPFSCEGT
jgi:hypothetical protein